MHSIVCARPVQGPCVCTASAPPLHRLCTASAPRQQLCSGARRASARPRAADAHHARGPQGGGAARTLALALALTLALTLALALALARNLNPNPNPNPNPSPNPN